MKKKFMFIHSEIKRKNIIIPKEIEINTKKIVGLYLNSCIRFYKEEKNYRLIKDRNMQRLLCASSNNFDINNNILSIDTKDSLIGEYNYNNGVLFANCDNYFDIIERDNIKLYLEDNYFKTKYLDIILGNEKTIMTRYTEQKPPIHIKRISKSKKTTY